MDKKLLVSIIGLTLVLTACGKRSKPNVILVVMDTTRADHLSCYGYDQDTSPILDSLARQGVLFERVASPAPATLPAVTSILSGLHPYHHGVRYNNYYRVGDGIPLLSEAFSRAGYRTAAFVSAYVLHSSFGLSRGFDLYDEQFAAGRKNLVGLDATAGSERQAAETTAGALRWLAESREPFFLLLHYFDPHYPYQPPAIYDGRFNSAYDGEIANVDLNIGRLLTFLRERDLLDNTLLLVTGDHGEGLAEHNEDTHAFNQYDTTLRVPLIIRFPDGAHAGRRIKPLVRLIDIAPSLLDYAGLEPWATLDGESLLPLLTRQAGGSRPAYAEAVAPYIEFRWPIIFSLNSGRYKLILKKRPELYDLYYDPGETRDLAMEKQELVAEMSGAIRKFYAAPGAVIVTGKLKTEEKQKLLSLGYFSGGSAPELAAGIFDFHLENSERLDDLRSLARRRDEVLYAERMETVRVALAELKELDRRNPGAPSVLTALAYAYLRQSRLPEAVEVFRRLSGIPEMEQDATEKLAYIYLQMGDLSAAERCFRHLLAAGDEAPEYYKALAEIERRKQGGAGKD